MTITREQLLESLHSDWGSFEDRLHIELIGHFAEHYLA
jgi:hypothetical protein